MKSTGIVLSGGGARGAAHLGVLKALGELGIKVSAISGVSAGGVIGALYAAGHSPVKILEELKEQSYFTITDFLWFKNGFFTMSSLRKKLEELIKDDSFEQLLMPLYVSATDICTSSSVTFSKGPLYDAIIASASVPVIFEPVDYQQYCLLDGAILNNLPVEPLLGNFDVIIGSHVNKISDGINHAKLNKAALMEQCFHLAIANSVKTRSEQCDIFIEPILTGFGMFDMKDADKIFEIGYNTAMGQKEKLLAVT